MLKFTEQMIQMNHMRYTSH